MMLSILQISMINYDNSSVFLETFEIKKQEGSVLKYINFRILLSHLVFSIHRSDNIIELVYEWFPDGNFWKFHTPFHTNSKYDKDIMYGIPLMVNSLQKYELDYNRTFGHNIGQIQNIGIMIRIYICHMVCWLVTNTVDVRSLDFNLSKVVYLFLLTIITNLSSINIIFMMDLMV